MIYILTGIAKSGKTLLSKEIATNYNISLFSTDYIMMMIHHGNNDSTLDIDASDSTVAKVLEPYIYGMIQTMIENDDTYIIEGVHFNTDFSKKLLLDFKGNISIVYLGYKEIALNAKIRELYKYKDSMSNPWLFNHNDQTVEEIVSYLIDESKRIYQECTSNHITYIDIYNINKQKEEIMHALIERQ